MDVVGRVLVRTAAFVVLSLAASAAARAQTVLGDVAGGYSALSASTGGMPLGWFVSVSRNLTENLSIAGEVTGNYQWASSDFTDVTSTRKEHTFLAGPRLLLTGSDKESVFAHLLIGAATATVSSTGTFGRTSVTTAATDTVICFEPGLGVDLDFNEATSLRVEVNYRSLTRSGTVGEFQFVAGVVHRFLR
ncbi:MAG TPA: outer membrane beta-barrel protein [Vicinamibacterales bacterium]|jgi:hypothetical protein